MQLYGVVGSFLAARAVGRTTLADLILTERASPQRVARLFTLSASKDSGRDLAFILLSGAFARCRARLIPGWTLQSMNWRVPRWHDNSMTIWTK
jgi:hypothetical protein